MRLSILLLEGMSPSTGCFPVSIEINFNRVKWILILSVSIDVSSASGKLRLRSPYTAGSISRDISPLTELLDRIVNSISVTVMALTPHSYIIYQQNVNEIRARGVCTRINGPRRTCSSKVGFPGGSQFIKPSKVRRSTVGDVSEAEFLVA